MSDEWVMVPRDLLQRVDAALQRHLDRHAPMRIPVDQTDSDLVQSDVQALIAAPAAPQQAEPAAQIGWADEFGNLFPMGAWKPTQRTHHDSHKAAWRPVFLHPPADEVRLQGGLDNEELLEAWRTKVPGVEPTDSDLRAFALGVEFGTRGKRVYFDERNSARDAWRRRVKQCETLEAEVQRLRDALEQIEREANQPYIQRIAAAALKVGE